jgi:hypothetical protein
MQIRLRVPSFSKTQISCGLSLIDLSKRLIFLLIHFLSFKIAISSFSFNVKFLKLSTGSLSHEELKKKVFILAN